MKSAPSTTKEPGPPLPDLPTVIAIAVVAYATAGILHEALGHGGACVALGGKPLVLSSVHFECDEKSMSALARRCVSAAGTGANFLAGLLGLVAFKSTNPLRKPHAAYFLWLFTTLNLLMGAGYFLFSGVGNIGDWASVASGSVSPIIWRPTMAVFGGGMYFLLACRSARWLRPLVGSDDLSRRRSKRLTVPAYFAGGVLSCISGLFNPVGPILIVISAAAASFGGTSGLLWLTEFLPDAEHAAGGADLRRSHVWIVAACVASLISIAILGPGIRF
jgi:hypothetical protein